MSTTSPVRRPGVVEADDLLGPDRVRPGDVLVAMGRAVCTPTATPSSATCCCDRAGWSLDRHVDDLGRTLGEELLEPTRLYAQPCLALARETRTHAMAHVTGGGLAANLARVLPPGVVAEVDRASWAPAPIFDLVRRIGEVALPDLEKTLNCGVGMVAVVHPDDATAAVSLLAAAGIPSWVVGGVFASVDERAEPVVRLLGAYSGW